MKAGAWAMWLSLSAVSAGCAAAPTLTKGLEVERHSNDDVIVVGGGLAGLVCAYELEKAGKHVVLLEASERFGGRVATAHYGPGVQAEYGLQEIWADNPLLQLAHELHVPLEPGGGAWSGTLIDGQLSPARGTTAKEQFESSLSPAERGPMEVWLEEARELRAKAQTEGLANEAVAKLQQVSFADWLRSAHLPHRVYETLRLTIEVELAASAEDFSALYGLMEFGVFLDNHTPYSAPQGNQQLIDALARSIRGPKTLGARVTRVERSENGVHVSYFLEQTQHTISGAQVVLAVPFFMLHAIQLSPPLDDGRARAVQSLLRGRYTVVHVLMQKEARALFAPKGELPFPILSDGPLGVIYGLAATPSEGEFEVFSLLIYGHQANAFHMVPRETKLAELRRALEKLWPGVSQYVVSSEVFPYHPGAVAVWPVGRSPLDAPSALVREPQLSTFIIGDWVYNSHSDGAVRSAQEAARRIVAVPAP